MAKVFINGHIESIKYKETSVEVIINELCAGYRDASGKKFDDEVLIWKVVFPNGSRNYLMKFFSEGMLVDVYGFIKPYAKDHDGRMMEGYSILGKNADRAVYQRSSIRKERQAIKDSQLHSTGTPNLKEYQEEDF